MKFVCNIFIGGMNTRDFGGFFTFRYASRSTDHVFCDLQYGILKCDHEEFVCNFMMSSVMCLLEVVTVMNWNKLKLYFIACVLFKICVGILANIHEE
jgi:hypothetical protein